MCLNLGFFFTSNKTQSSFKPMTKTAAEFKDAGNRAFQEHRFDDAIKFYSKAIELKSDPSYYTNRSLCFMKLKELDRAGQDCRSALELDKRNVKANFFLGKILFTQGLLEESILMLTRAQEAAQSQKLNYGDEITSFVRQVRKEMFRIEEEKRINQEIELQSYLNELIDRDIDRRTAELLETNESRNDDSITSKMEDIKQDALIKKKELNSLFEEVDDRRKKRDIPDYLCGKISFELLKDPVVTPSGITYDRPDIMAHLSKVGHFDPITRAPLTSDDLIPNLVMKEVLEDYIRNNEWCLSI